MFAVLSVPPNSTGLLDGTGHHGSGINFSASAGLPLRCQPTHVKSVPAMTRAIHPHEMSRPVPTCGALASSSPPCPTPSACRPDSARAQDSMALMMAAHAAATGRIAPASAAESMRTELPEGSRTPPVGAAGEEWVVTIYQGPPTFMRHQKYYRKKSVSSQRSCCIQNRKYCLVRSSMPPLSF